MGAWIEIDHPQLWWYLHHRRSPRGSVDWNVSVIFQRGYLSVAPLVGAWIEINYEKSAQEATYVAPLVGAWIEIDTLCQYHLPGKVAPLVGAWIEIWQYSLWDILSVVAPLVGAWIEIKSSLLFWVVRVRRSPRGSVDWNLFSHTHHPLFTTSLPSWERGLKSVELFHDLPKYGRSPRGSVDWNTVKRVQWTYKVVAPLVGAWIEIAHNLYCLRSTESRSPRGSVDWNWIGYR